MRSGRRSRVVAPLGAAFAALVAACAGPDVPPPVVPAPDAAPAPRVFVTGDTQGYLQPCGCDEGQLGGLPRRATYLRAARQPGDLVVDLGNAVAGTTPAHATILAYALRGMRGIGYDAVVPGEGEVRLGEAFEALAGREGPPAVSANLRRADTGARVFEPWLLRELPDGRRLAVVGITGPVAAAPSAYRIDPPAEALRAALDELGGAADAVVVATTLGEEEALALAGRARRAALVLCGRARRKPAGLVATEGAPVAFVREYGSYVTRVELDGALRAASARQAVLDELYADDPELAALVLAHRAEVSAANGDLAARLVAAYRSEGYAGAAACRDCHEAESAAWAASRHAHAVAALLPKKAQRDPGCLPCHLRDVPAEGEDYLDERHGVGCEACHGPAARHVADALDGRRPERLRRLGAAGAATCLGCHDPRNSPRFDFAEYWPRIAHGRAR